MHSFQGRCRAWTFCGVGFREVRSLGIYMIRPHVKMFLGWKISGTRTFTEDMCASGRTWSGLHAQQTFQPVTTAFATRKPSTLQVKLGVKSTCLLGNSMCVLFSMEPHIVELLLCFQPRMLWTSMSWPGPTNLISMLLLLIVNWNHTSRLADWQIGWRCAQINHHYLTVFFILGKASNPLCDGDALLLVSTEPLQHLVWFRFPCFTKSLTCVSHWP